MSTPAHPPFVQVVESVLSGLGSVIRGKPEALRTLLVGVLAGGHVLLEDVPGVGKTTLAKALARLLDLSYARIQFTPDLLPSDVLGAQLLDPRQGTLTFQPGPVFTHVLLADEINRASPRTQSALLEAMNEEQVSIDGQTRKLPHPFFVLATQNPVDFAGTFPLPEAQLDRFTVRLALGYPSEEDEVRMMLDRRTSDPLSELSPVVEEGTLLEMLRTVREVVVHERIARYVRRLVAATREAEALVLGASPRASLMLVRAAQASAAMAGRTYVAAEDVLSLVGPVLGHRVQLSQKARYGGRTAEQLVLELSSAVQAPT